MRLTKKAKLQKFEIDNSCTCIQTFIKQYGNRCYSAIEKLHLHILQYIDNYFIYNNDISKLIEYLSQITPKAGISYVELELINYIKSFYTGIIKHTDRKSIYPKELDIYLPDLKLGIEYNGNYWHSIENGTNIDSHLNKSLLCREKGIRLIHIYEFEDFEEQKILLKSLIEGKDRYSKEDFNKNNLINTIPQPEIIYSKGYTIYGAGKLY